MDGHALRTWRFTGIHRLFGPLTEDRLKRTAGPSVTSGQKKIMEAESLTSHGEDFDLAFELAGLTARSSLHAVFGGVAFHLFDQRLPTDPKEFGCLRLVVPCTVEGQSNEEFFRFSKVEI